MRIAVIGSGIAGLVCARLLSRDHDVTLFERDARVGGHVNTVSVDHHGECHQIDTGFIVYNERTYPKFTRILADLNVPTQPTSMSFSVQCEQTGLEYNGTSFNGVFAQRRNLFRPSFLAMLRDIIRFNREGNREDIENITVGDFLNRRGYSSHFADKYLLPMGASIWSCPHDDFLQFPIQFILEFYANHGLLSLRDRPTWRVIAGGSKEYVSRLTRPFANRIRLNCGVKAVQRRSDDVRILHKEGEDLFDEVIFACHSNQALRLLVDADKREVDLLSSFPYRTNSAVLHTDPSILPRRRRAWASWNYHIAKEDSALPTVTYNLNILQGIKSRNTFCVTLNDDERIDPTKIIRRFDYSHPIFTLNRSEVQKRHPEVIRHRHTSFCGAYWRNGFHEDGVVSALTVCKRFGIPDWTPESMPVHIRNCDEVAS